MRTPVQIVEGLEPFSTGLTMTTELSTIAPHVVAREKSAMPFTESSQGKMNRQCIGPKMLGESEAQGEFRFPDESLAMMLTHEYRCRVCQLPAALVREQELGKWKFQVTCVNATCQCRTTWSNSSRGAVNSWKMLIALQR